MASTADAYKVNFSEPKSGLNVTIGISTILMERWGMHTDQLIPTVTVLIDEVLQNHNPSKPLLSEYMFSPENSGITLDATIDLIRRNQI